MAWIVLFTSVLLFAYVSSQDEQQVTQQAFIPSLVSSQDEQQVTQQAFIPSSDSRHVPFTVNKPFELAFGAISDLSAYAATTLGAHLLHAQMLVNDIESGVKHSIDKVDSFITAHLHSVDKAWVKFVTGKESDEEIAKCEDLRGYLVTSANATLRTVTECLTDKYNEGKEHLNTISNLVESTLESIHTHFDEANKCLDNVNDWENEMQGDLCAAKTVWTVIADTILEVPQVEVQIVKLVTLITTLPQSLPICFREKVAASILQDFYRLVNDVKSCIENLSSAGTEVHTTTADQLLS